MDVALLQGMTLIGRLAIVMATVAIGAGCTITHRVARPLSPESVTEINATAGGDRPLEIDFHPPGPHMFAPSVRAKALLPDADGKQVSFVDLGGERRSIESGRVSGVHVTSRGQGALHGLVVGALAGAAGGIVWGASTNSGILSDEAVMVIGGGCSARSAPRSV